MTEKYYKKKIDVKKHKRFDPRTNQMVDVKGYKRNKKIQQHKKKYEKKVEKRIKKGKNIGWGW